MGKDAPAGGSTTRTAVERKVRERHATCYGLRVEFFNETKTRRPLFLLRRSLHELGPRQVP